MGRIFETRKATMFARWDRMSKLFSRIGEEITIAVRKGGPNPDSNPALRRVIQNARAANMPKEKVENAIKKSAKFLGTPSATDKTHSDDFGAGLIQARAALLGMGIKK